MNDISTGPLQTSNVVQQFPHVPQECVPRGLESLYTALLKLYPSQRNPLQVAAMQKYWLGGPDILDYVCMYSNPGNVERKIPSHWHYVSMGLSDLHGDGRVHPTKDSTQPSGYGFELTFRLKKSEDETYPPTWPAGLLQQLAKSVMAGRKYFAGDSITWHLSLDGCGQSRLKHILLADDVQLPTLRTQLGYVNFVQVVGACDEELKAAQRWNGHGILQLLRNNLYTGGELLITDMRRRSTIFELDFKAREALDRGVATEGSNLSGVSNVRCVWSEWGQHLYAVASGDWRQQNDDRNLNGNEETVYRGVEISMNFEAAIMLPMMLQSRLAHGRHFTFTNAAQTGGITFVTPDVTGSVVNPTRPYVAAGGWLQVYVGPELHQAMQMELGELDEVDIENRICFPKMYEWKNLRLKIVVTPENVN